MQEEENNPETNNNKPEVIQAQMNPAETPSTPDAPTTPQITPSAPTIEPSTSSQSIITPAIPAQGVNVVLGNNDTSLKTQKSLRFKFSPIILISASGLLVLIVLLYMFILPSMWSSSYSKKVQTAYNQQSSQMSDVYKSLNGPVFSGTTITAAGNNELQNIADSISTANTNTSSLKAKNHLIVLPGTTWQKSVSSANQTYQSMKKYISDSTAFLTDYNEFVTYIQQYEQISINQFPTLINQLSIINKGAQASTFIGDLQTASATIGDISNKFSKLKPSPDLVEFNQSVVNNLSDISNALASQIGDIQTNSQQAFNDQKAIYVSAYQTLATTLNSHPLANLQTNSIVHSQITALENEHPLK
jgi:hypothetical protein